MPGLWLLTFLSILASLFTAYLADVCPWEFYSCIRSPPRDLRGYPSVKCKIIYKRVCDNCIGARSTRLLCAKRQLVIRRVTEINQLMCGNMCKPTWCSWQPWREHNHQCGTEIRRREKCCHPHIPGHPLSNRCDLDADPAKRVEVRSRPCAPGPTLLGAGSTSAVYFHIIVTAGGCCLLALLLITIYLKRHQLCARPRHEATPTELRGLAGPAPGPLPLHQCLQGRDPPRYEEALRASHCYTPPPAYDVVMATMLQGKRQDSRGRMEI